MGERAAARCVSRRAEEAHRAKESGRGDPLVRYLAYVMEEVEERNPLAAFFLGMTIQSLLEDARPVQEPRQ